ncbi:olfactory receptor 51G2-like [Carettochelys insculpta]|uniref:olfactory receptor 51G2-like n=1 Tax=Carettochelys insculpta TaxID=44489 RepID=UPI003EBAC10A
MSDVNETKFKFTVFLLSGIPGQESNFLWISIPFCLMYIVSIVGNSGILFIVKTDPSLHEPMYIFLSTLAITDLGLSIVTLPTIMGILWFNSREISPNACFAQLFFIHSLQCIESSVLLVMAFDRFIAISNPLRYTSILTLPRTVGMALLCVLRGAAITLPLPFLVQRFPYWRKNILSHSYCLHQEVMKMASADITVNNIYGLCVVLLTMGTDSFLIFLSYVMILKTVLNVTSRKECLTALNTCVSHLCAVLLFYIPFVGVAVIPRFGNSSSLTLQISMGYVYMFLPPVINPIVYSVKSKQLRARIIRAFAK